MNSLLENSSPSARIALIQNMLFSAGIALQNLGSALNPDVYSAGIAFAIAMILGAFFRSLLAVCIIAIFIGTFGSNFLAVCQTAFPSWALKGQSAIDTLFLKIKGGRTSQLKDIKVLIKDAEKFMADLDTEGGGGYLSRANDSAVQAKAIVGNIANIAEYIEEVHSKANTPGWALMCNDIAKHAPVIGVAFTALQPVLLQFVKAKSTDELAVKTSNRITGLLKEVKSAIAQAAKDKVDLTRDEVSDIHSLLLVIEEGLKLAGKVMEGRKSRIARVLRAGNHSDLLEGWLEMTNKFLETDERKKITVSSIRIRHILETQRKYFAVLTFTSVVNTTILLALAFGVFFIIIPLLNLLNQDSVPVAMLKWVAEKGNNCMGWVKKEDFYGYMSRFILLSA